MRIGWRSWAWVALLAAAVVWSWPVVRPVFSGGVEAMSGLLERAGGWGPLAVIGLQVMQAVVSPLPSWPVTVAAGAAYGAWAGAGYSLIGGTLGAAINFALARRLGAPLVRKRLGEKWLRRADQVRPWHLLLATMIARLIPVTSFDVVAYLAGLSGVSLPVFLGVAAVGQAPALFTYAYFGSDLARAESAGLIGTLLLVALLLLSVLGRHLWQRFAS